MKQPMSSLASAIRAAADEKARQESLHAEIPASQLISAERELPGEKNKSKDTAPVGRTHLATTNPVGRTHSAATDPVGRTHLAATDLVMLSVRVLRRERLHWLVEAKRQGTSLTDAVTEALTRRFGLPKVE